MKLLTWMHRKFRQGSGEALKEFPLGQPLIDDHQVYQKQGGHGMSGSALRQAHRGECQQRRRSFANLETTRFEAGLEAKEAAAAEHFQDYFEGFLAIGTLGTADAEVSMSSSGPGTPTLAAASLEKLAEGGEAEATENELRLINDELERVLAAETDSSGRNSHVSNGRISHASTITLGGNGKPLEIPESLAGARNSSVCPLQEFLLGSAVELPDQRPVAAAGAGAKEHRTSLGELFERHKAEESTEAGGRWKPRGGERKEERDQGDHRPPTTSKNIVKKMLMKKKLGSHGSSKNSSSATPTNQQQGFAESSAAETKLCKILHKFHKKVHPECLTSTAKSEKPHRGGNGIKSFISCNGSSYYYYKEGHSTLPEEEVTTALSQLSQPQPQGALRKDSVPHNKRRLISSAAHLGVEGDSDSNGSSRECWIKTDADYLVLEL